MTIAMMTLFKEDPKTAMMARTMIRPGTAIIASTTRCTSRSTVRPAYADTMPTTNQGAARPVDSVRVSGMALATIVSRPAIIRSSGGMTLLVPDPGIEHAVRQVDGQVEDQDDRGDQDDNGLQHDEIPVDDTVDQ